MAEIQAQILRLDYEKKSPTFFYFWLIFIRTESFGRLWLNVLSRVEQMIGVVVTSEQTALSNSEQAIEEHHDSESRTRRTSLFER